MKVLFDHHEPFLLFHGGLQVQIEQTIRGVAAAGVEVDHLRWWDGSQTGDVIHFFGRPNIDYVNQAHAKGMKVVMTDLLTGVGSRAAWLRYLQKWVVFSGLRVLPRMVLARFGWLSLRSVDAALYQTAWEAHLAEEVFHIPRERIHVIVNGTEEVFLNGKPVPRGPWLVCTATITERKRVVEAAEAAIAAQTPLWVIGKPYADHLPYAQRFMELARQHPKLIRYEGGIQDRAKLAAVYREARGFVLLSTRESLSLSSSEAAACQTPLLLSDLPWARTAFGDGASYCPITSVVQTAEVLKKFYDAAPTLPPPPRPPTWVEVGHQFKAVYEKLLKK